MLGMVCQPGIRHITQQEGERMIKPCSSAPKEQRDILWWASVTSEASSGLPLLAGAGHSATPAGKWRGSAGRPSPMSATTSMGQRPSADPYTFTVTDRKVGFGLIGFAAQHSITHQDEHLRAKGPCSICCHVHRGQCRELHALCRTIMRCAKCLSAVPMPAPVHNSTTGPQSVLDSAVQTGLPATAGGG